MKVSSLAILSIFCYFQKWAEDYYPEAGLGHWKETEDHGQEAGPDPGKEAEDHDQETGPDLEEEDHGQETGPEAKIDALEKMNFE